MGNSREIRRRSVNHFDRSRGIGYPIDGPRPVAYLFRMRRRRHWATAGLWWLVAAVTGCGDACGSACGQEPEPAHPALTGLLRPVIIGHGGAKQLCAANTLACFQRAIDEGARAMEADLQVLGDGSLVMFHDDNALRQTGRDVALRELDLDGLRALDAGWGFSPDGGLTYPLRGQGLRVPTLETFLNAFPGLPVLLDVKPECPEMRAALLRFVGSPAYTAAIRQRVYIKVNDNALAAALRGLEPPPRVAFSSAERAELVMTPEAVAHLDPSWIDLNPPYLTAALVDWAHDQRHLITASTLDEMAELERLIERLPGLDGIVTNRPDRLRELLQR
jgi:glycerophosphoryl diester phosphodiesterase